MLETLKEISAQWLSGNVSAHPSVARRIAAPTWLKNTANSIGTSHEV
jgi:hypothetical protein